ncbi:MAG: DNA repair protein RadC [Candidatus Pacearchaeota archaeon]|nr:MAG: DNA repair protein RadC [Candidatus Pacearchaeota archaeon]
MKIRDLPDSSKPRERFLKHGPEALSDAELFAILLRTGTRGKKGQVGENVIEMSNRLINEYGLDKLLECSLTELQKINGIGPSKAMQILTIAELQKRINQSKKPIKKITCAEDVFNLFHERLKDEKQENFYILMLNNRNNVIGEQLITKGILDASLVHSREIFRSAIKNSAAKIILIHNHPSGDSAPSQGDINVTERIREAGKLLKIKLTDHIIMGNKEYYSFREEQKI